MMCASSLTLGCFRNDATGLVTQKALPCFRNRKKRDVKGEAFKEQRGMN